MLLLSVSVARVDAQGLDPTQVAVDMADIDGDCYLVDSQRGFDRHFDADLYAVVYQCQADNIVLNGAFVFDRSPLIVANVVAVTTDPGSLMLSLLEEGLPAITEYEETEIFAPSLGPRIGQETTWYMLTKETRGLHYDGYLATFAEGPAAVLVFCGGFRGQNTLKCTADLAHLVAARIREA